jgi:hypothetical protein
MSVTLAKVLAARPVEVGDDQLDLFAETMSAENRDNGRCPCPTPELCSPTPKTCWKR